MAAKGKKAPKTNVFWSKDPDDEKIVKVHMPGVLLEPHVNVKNPMVRKPVHMMKPRVVTLQKSLHNSLEKRQHDLSRSGTNKSPSKSGSGSLLSYDGELSGGSHPGGNDKTRKELTLKELNPQDKKRVANLVKELAKVGEEREHAEERLKAERLAFEERLVILQEEYDAVIKEKICLQKRFLELQSLLVKYQTNGRASSPTKTVKSSLAGDKPVQDSSLLHVSSVSSPKPVHISPPKPTLTAGIPGNTRPGLAVPLSEKFDTSGLQANVSEPVANETFPLNNRTSTECKDAKSKPVQLHSSSLTLSDVRESSPGILGPSQGGKPVVRSSSGPLPTATPSKVTSPNRQFVRIPQTSVQKEGLSYNSKEPSKPSVNTSSLVTSFPHLPSVVNSQPAMHPGLAASFQYPAAQAKPVLSVFGNGVTETKTDWKIPPRKNEDRSFSEVSGVSGSFSAELDAVYRLYCREYELQLQLQQQQIELQKQQLQLQQQLQQVETLQQQQQQQQKQQQQQPPTHESVNHVSSATQVSPVATHEKHLTTVVDETPTAPSLVPRPISQPRQVSPARSLVPTPEVSSSAASNGCGISKVGEQQPRNLSITGACVLREDRCAGDEMSSNIDHRMQLGKENKAPHVPDPPGRVLSAPPSLDQPRSNHKHRQVPRPQVELHVSADHSYRGQAAPGYEGHPMDDDVPNFHQNMDGRASSGYYVNRPASSRYSLHSRGHDESSHRELMPLRERRHIHDLNIDYDTLSGRESNSLLYPRSIKYDTDSERSSLVTESSRSDSFLSGTRRTKPQSFYHGPPTSRIQGPFKRQAVPSDKQFSLHSDIKREAQTRDHHMFPDVDDVRGYSYGNLGQGVERPSPDSAYPLSLVEIVEDLEDNITQQKDFLFTNPGVVGELDTTDSGYSQCTNKERSPLTSDIVNLDDEEAAVLGDIFFLAGRV